MDDDLLHFNEYHQGSFKIDIGLKYISFNLKWQMFLNCLSRVHNDEEGAEIMRFKNSFKIIHNRL